MTEIPRLPDYFDVFLSPTWGVLTTGDSHCSWKRWQFRNPPGLCCSFLVVVLFARNSRQMGLGVYYNTGNVLFYKLYQYHPPKYYTFKTIILISLTSLKLCRTVPVLWRTNLVNTVDANASALGLRPLYWLSEKEVFLYPQKIFAFPVSNYDTHYKVCLCFVKRFIQQLPLPPLFISHAACYLSLVTSYWLPSCLQHFKERKNTALKWSISIIYITNYPLWNTRLSIALQPCTYQYRKCNHAAGVEEHYAYQLHSYYIAYAINPCLRYNHQWSYDLIQGNNSSTIRWVWDDCNRPIQMHPNGVASWPSCTRPM